MVTCQKVYFEIAVINLYKGIEAFSNGSSWLADGAWIEKECFAFHPSTWHMQVTIETDIGIFFLSPVVQLLKVEIDIKLVSVSLDDLCRTKLSHQTFWIASIKVHVAFDDMDTLPEW